MNLARLEKGESIKDVLGPDNPEPKSPARKFFCNVKVQSIAIVIGFFIVLFFGVRRYGKYAHRIPWLVNRLTLQKGTITCFRNLTSKKLNFDSQKILVRIYFTIQLRIDVLY
jgi:hypothetical protein